MKIVADENLALTDYFFSDFGQIHYQAGRHLTQHDVKDAEALLVRSVTQVNAKLLEQTQVRFVGSATIGTDHLDIAALEQLKIRWSNAAGCNAQAVAEYVITALLQVNPALLHAQRNFTLGIVGLGNVGSRLAKMAALLDWNIIAYDPWVHSAEVTQTSFQALLQQADAISIHVPLTQTGEYPTHHLFNAAALASMKPEAILLNSARGAVVSETALLDDLSRTQRKVVLDVFEHEPVISQQLLDKVTLVTPHIAGYSLEGKARGTQMIYEAFCHTLDVVPHKRFESQLPEAPQYFSQQDLKTALAEHLTQIYDIAQDDANLRACVQDGQVNQQAFDQLRKNYPLRREWAAHGGPQA